LFYHKLLKSLSLPLPGDVARRLMWAPHRELMRDFEKKELPRKSAVAVILFPDKSNNIHLLLIRRTSDKSHHSGQISFPGGKAESGDADLKSTALRELFEETGIKNDSLKYAGELSQLYIPVSHFMVYPHVFYCHNLPENKPNSAEVQYILTVPISVFTEGNHVSTYSINWENKEYVFPCYKYNEEIIWGATAMIIAELAEIIK